MSVANSAAPNAARPCEIETPDGRLLYARRWGERDASQLFVVVHGVGEHTDSYESFAAEMTRHGCAVLVYDQHGHGYSPGRRGAAPGLRTMINDIDVAIQAGRENWPNATPTLVGHSMGGNIVLAYLMTASHPRLRAVLTNPMLLPPNPPTRYQIISARITCKLFPWLRVSDPPDPQQLTQDPEMIQAIVRDPVIHSSLAVGIATELLSQGQWLLDNAQLLKDEVLVLLGDDDDLTDQSATRRFASRSPFCTIKSFSGLRHNLLMEKEREVVFQAMLDWVNAAAVAKNMGGLKAAASLRSAS